MNLAHFGDLECKKEKYMKIIIVYEVNNIRLQCATRSYSEAGEVCKKISEDGNRVISVTVA